MTQQMSLFALDAVVRSPICVYDRHCGAKAVLGPQQETGTCINCSITCQRCGRDGVQSTRKYLRKE